MMKHAVIALLWGLVLLPAHAANRVALLIGNASYSVGRLTNPPADVREMEAALKAVGFSVQTVLNANQNAMKRAVRDFGTMAEGADIAFLYYSGHGTQANGENYLIPVQATIEKTSDYEVEAVSANAVMRQITDAKPKAAIVVLDACRDNPLAATTRSASKGLGRMDAPTGTMIAFATAPNTTATDEGVYARTLARQIRTPGQTLVDVFLNTSAEVRKATAGKQEPRISEVSITDKIYLVEGTGTQVATLVPEPIALRPTPTPAPQPSPSRPASNDPDTALWNAVESGATADDYAVYIGQYPKGKFVALAKQRLQKLKDEAARATSAAEENAWATAESSASEAGYQSYLKAYPQGRYAALAQPRINKLKAQAAERERLAAEQLRQQQAEAAQDKERKRDSREAISTPPGKGRIGIQIEAVSKEVAESIGWKKPVGAMVRSVEAASPAEKAGIKGGDIIVGVDGNMIETSSQLPKIIGAITPGSNAKLAIFRSGSTISLIVTIAQALPASGADPVNKVDDKEAEEFYKRFGIPKPNK